MCGKACGDWSTLGGDSSHDGWVRATVETATPTLEWTTNVGPFDSDGVNNLAVGSGNVFVVPGSIIEGTYPCLYALNQQTGATSWSISYTANPIVDDSAPAYSNGIVYFQTTANQAPSLHAFNASSGTSIFNAPFGSQAARYQNPVVYNGSIYMGGGGYGGEYSFNASTGAQNWFTALGQHDGWTPAVDANYCYSFIGDQLQMLNRSNGAIAATVTKGTNVETCTVALGSENDVIVLDNAGGFNVYSNTLNGSQYPSLKYTVAGRFGQLPAVTDGFIYAIKSGNLVAFNESDGSVSWTWNSGGVLSGEVLATDNAIIVGSGSNTFAIGLSSHSEMWSVPTGGALALTDDTLYLANSAGQVSAYQVAVPEPGCTATLFAMSGLLGRAAKRRHHASAFGAERFSG